jgi:hypothetical protein
MSRDFMTMADAPCLGFLDMGFPPDELFGMAKSSEERTVHERLNSTVTFDSENNHGGSSRKVGGRTS